MFSCELRVSFCSGHTALLENIYNQETRGDVLFTSTALVFLSFSVPPIPLILLVLPPPPAWCFFPNAAVNSKQLSGRSFETKRGLFHCSCIVTVGLQLPSLATNRVYITRKQMTYRKWAEKHHVFFFFRGVVVY